MPCFGLILANPHDTSCAVAAIPYDAPDKRKTGPGLRPGPDLCKTSKFELTLAELRALAGLLQAVLLALDHTRVARQIASLLEL